MESIMTVTRTGPDGAVASPQAMDGGGDRYIAWEASPRQFQASVAASNVLQSGGDMDEAFRAAKAVMEPEKGNGDRTTMEPESDMLDLTADKKAVEMRRYMLAVARLGSGKFDDLSNEQLLDVVCLVKQAVIPIEQWVKVTRQVMEQAR